jgi:preprotein translocase subunit SecE
VARQSRAERRARRQQQGEPALAGAGNGGDDSQVRLTPEPPSKPERGVKPGQPSGGMWFGARLWRFFGESWGELRKTEWPSQNHVIQGTVVVLMACIILGTFIWLCDLAFKALVHDVLIK